MALVDALCASSVDNAALVYSTFNAAGFLFDNAAGFYDDTGIAGGPALALQAADRAPGLSAAGDVAPCLEKQATLSPAPPRRKRRRRARSCKSREETECQRMTHIAVERNRRRQMNEYLVVLRSLMPESYVQRGDQASIVGGAIDFVKELEQQLQSLEAQKRALAHQQQHKAGRDAAPLPTAMPARASTSGGIGNACSRRAAVRGVLHVPAVRVAPVAARRHDAVGGREPRRGGRHRGDPGGDARQPPRHGAAAARPAAPHGRRPAGAPSHRAAPQRHRARLPGPLLPQPQGT
uniref:BHLH domain-containing protein n=1 Tax=Aegilops tauschii subsp. strangulata TaxID=200361 RepID=A0A453PAZ5_AEGTS